MKSEDKFWAYVWTLAAIVAVSLFLMLGVVICKEISSDTIRFEKCLSVDGTWIRPNHCIRK